MTSTPHTVGDVMTRTVVAVGRHATFKEVVRTLEQWKVSALPVLEGEGRVIGVVSEADLLAKEEFRDAGPDDDRSTHRLQSLAKAGAETAEELMSTPAVTVHADASLPEAARIMAVKHVKRLPVTGEGGLLTGVVSRSDLLKVFLRPDDELAREARERLAQLFPVPLAPLDVTVAEGVVTVTGVVRDTSLIPAAVQLLRGIEGVIAVDSRLTRGYGNRTMR